MRKKFIPLILMIVTALCLSSVSSFADSNTNGKTIVINMNRTNLEHMDDIKVLKEELNKRGYVGLMNVRGDGGNNDIRAYATIGAGRRANVTSDNYFDFKDATEQSLKQFKSMTGQNGKAINNLSINKMNTYNSDNGQYGATLGAIGQTLSDNDLKVAVLGNADTGTEEDELNRNIGLMAMDNLGRIELGNVDDINIEDSSMPFGIRTDYDKLISETKKYYEESDVLFVELGDTTRLDLFKEYLNEETTNSVRKAIYNNINTYLEEVFNLVNKNDNVYIISAYPSKVDYANKRRLSPVIKFDGEGKGLLHSATTRRSGIIGNVDIGVDILNTYGLQNEQTVGKAFTYIDKTDNLEYIKHEFEKIVTIATVRTNIVNTFVTVVAASWVITMLLLLVSKKIPKEDTKRKVFTVLKELVKLGMIMPLAFVVAPIFNFKTPTTVTLGIVGTILAIYLVATLLFRRNDTKQMLFYTTLTVLIISIDCIFGTPLQKSSIMSYDAIVGARYYGMGNEFQGIIIGCSLFTFTTLLTYNKLPKWAVVLLSFIILITTASPTMGANVGASISEFVAFFTLILLVYNVKIDLKKILLIGIGVVVVVGSFAMIDIISGSESHLSLFIGQIFENGPSAIIETFSRKISMNLKLAKTSIWVNILLVGTGVIGILLLKPNKKTNKLAAKHPMLYKGFLANLVGCLITLLVNDSGIVSASTAAIYILIPLVIITVNSVIFNKDN